MVEKDRYKEVVKISLSENDERDISLIDGRGKLFPMLILSGYIE